MGSANHVSNRKTSTEAAEKTQFIRQFVFVKEKQVTLAEVAYMGEQSKTKSAAEFKRGS